MSKFKNYRIWYTPKGLMPRKEDSCVACKVEITADGAYMLQKDIWNALLEFVCSKCAGGVRKAEKVFREYGRIK